MGPRNLAFFFSLSGNILEELRTKTLLLMLLPEMSSNSAFGQILRVSFFYYDLAGRLQQLARLTLQPRTTVPCSARPL